MEGKEFVITRLESRHIPEVEALDQACISPPWAGKSFESELVQPGGHAWILQSSGRTLGYIIIRALYTEAELLRIAVAVGARGSGYGGHLLRHAMEHLSRGGVNRVYLEVRASNTSARHFYEKYGFQVSGIRPGYYSGPTEDAVLMTLTL